MITNKELSMRLKTAGFEAVASECWAQAKENQDSMYGDCLKDEWRLLWNLGDFYVEEAWYNQTPAYDAEVLYEWLRGWHRDDPFRSFSIENDGIAVFDWGPRDSDKWIEYEDSLATTMAKTILWILEDKS